MNNQPAADFPPHPPPRRSFGWVWFFVTVAVLAVGAAAALWVYNVRQQLTSEDLAAAERLWKEKGPGDYALTITRTITREGSATETLVATVRGGKVQKLVRKQEVVQGGKVTTEDVPLPERLFSYYDMEGQFSDLRQFLKIKQDPKKGRVFLRAGFDPDDGHLTGYVYSNSQENQRVQVTVLLKRLPAEKSSP